MNDIEYRMENSKLVTFSNGQLELDEKVLQAFVNQINPSLSGLPVAILSIIGPPRSGKSFYTNLLIKYLENRSDDWLTEFSSSDTITKESLHGFAFGDVTYGNIVPNQADSGIYIWPNPLLIKNYGGKVLLCILHFHECKQSECDEAVYILHLLLRLLCSRITEIKWSFNKFSGFLFDTNDSLSSNSTIPKIMACQSFITLYRAQCHLLDRLMEEKQKSTTTSSADKSNNAVSNLKNGVNSCNVVYIEESLESLHDFFGNLKLTASMHIQVDSAIKFIADGNKIFPKLDENGKELTASVIQKYFSFSVLTVNEYINCRKQQILNEPLIKLEKEKAEQERARLRSEQKRREEEEKCAKFVEDALVELEHQLKDQLDRWLKKTLNISTIDHCQQMYEYSFKKTLDNIMSLDMSVEWLDKVKQMLLERSKRAKGKLERIHIVVTAFHSHVYGIMQKNCCLASETMVHELRHRIEDEDEYVMKCAQLGCSKLAPIFIAQNESIAAFEMKLLLIACQHIRKLYNEKLGEATRTYHFSPKQIFDFHSALKKFCIEKVQSVFRVTRNASSTYTFIAIEMEKQLNKQLVKDYEDYKLLNLKKLKYLHEKTMKIISKHKAAYCFQMENRLRESPNGIPGGAFETQHLTISKDVINDLKIELRETINPREPTQGSINLIIDHINMFWVNFNRLNKEQLSLSKQGDFEKSSRTHENKYKQDTPQVDPLSSHDSNKPSTENNSDDVSFVDKNTKLSPIIFKLSLSKIGTHIQYKNKQRTIGDFPAVVSATVDGLLVMGDENETNKSACNQIMKLGDYLLANQKSDRQEQVKIGDEIYSINAVLLLGFILYSLKQRVEKKYKGFASECVITIPFWLTSKQRQEIKDSGQSAGFKVTHLINENSAAALHYCRSNFDEGKDDIVVLSENSGCVDVTIYSYEKCLGVVTITGCASFYDYKRIAESAASDKVTYLVEKVKESYKISQKMSDAKLRIYNRLKEKTVVVSTESDVWKEVFVTVGKGIGKKGKLEGLNEPLVVDGAFTFSESPSTKRKTMKDWLSASIFRRSGKQKETMVQQKKDCATSTPRERNFVNDYFDFRDNEAVYFQKDITGQEVVIGRLKWNSPDTHWANIYFEVSEEAIVSLIPKHPSSSTGLEWSQQYLDETQLALYLSLFESFDLITKEFEERDRKKQDLIKQGKILLQRIENAVFRSTLARDMALTQIKESLNLLKHPKITAKEIERQLELFEKYETKLCPK